MAFSLKHLLPSEEDEEREIKADLTTPEIAELGVNWKLVGIVFALALIPRFFVLFFLTDPQNAGDGWHGDIYHHWQIAYLTQQIGLWSPDGPRLWDLKGLDYFWGILHPIVLVALFAITGSTDIVIARLFIVVCGAGLCGLIYGITNLYWGRYVAIASAAAAVFLPTSVFLDVTGFLEPLGIVLCLWGIAIVKRKGFWGGVVWALAAMSRAEAWVFSAGMIIAVLIDKLKGEKKLAMVLGWGIMIAIYMKILLDRTNNAIYPVYWNFLANAAGRWEYRAGLSSEQIAIRPYLGVLMVLGAIGLLATLKWKTKGYLFLTFGFGYLFFTGLTLGFTAYLKSWENWFWMERFLVFPYTFGFILLAILFLYVLPRRFGEFLTLPLFATLMVLLLATQLAWAPILAKYHETDQGYKVAVLSGTQIGQVWQKTGQGNIAVPAGSADVTYTMDHYGHVPGKVLISELYDPFYYIPSKYHYSYKNYPENTTVLLECFLNKDKVHLLAVDPHDENWNLMTKSHPQWFNDQGVIPVGWELYSVNVPPTSIKDCKAADVEAHMK